MRHTYETKHIIQLIRGMRNNNVPIDRVISWLLENHYDTLRQIDRELRSKLPKDKPTGRRRQVYPSPFLAVATLLYEGYYSCEVISKEINKYAEPKHRMCDDTLRIRLRELGIHVRSHEEKAVAIRKGPRNPPRVNRDAAMGAALVQGDAAVRIKRRSILEISLNTSDEGFARTIGNFFKHYGTVLVRGQEIIKGGYYEWNVTAWLNLRQWHFLIEAKEIHHAPEIVKTMDDFRAYLAMLIACEGWISWYPLNAKRGKPTTEFIVGLSNTDLELLEDIENRLKQLGYHPRKSLRVKKGFVHVDRYGRKFISKENCYALILCRKNEVQRFLEWIGKIPHPFKEVWRQWALRLLRRYGGTPIPWEVAGPIRDRLEKIYETSLKMSQKRAREDYQQRISEIKKGIRPDRRPRRCRLNC